MRSLVLLVLALPVGTSGRDRSDREEPACVVARGHGFVITSADVQELRAALSPAPPYGAASRLALDVAVAQWLTDGRVEPLPVREKLRRYRAKVVDVLAERGAEGLAQSFGEARGKLRVELGPCYVNLESERVVHSSTITNSLPHS